MEKNQILPGEVLANLLLDKGGPCLTLTVSLEKLNPAREANSRILKEYTSLVEDQWQRLFPGKNGQFFLEPLHDFIDKIDLGNPPLGIGIYISPKQAHCIHFLFAPPMRVCWNDRFLIRDLVYQLQLQQRFLILTVTEKRARLFECENDQCSQIQDGVISTPFYDNYEYNSPARSTSYAGYSHVKSYEREEEEVLAAHRRKYFKVVKERLAQYRTHQTPLVLVAQKELLSELDLEGKANEPVVHVNRDPSHDSASTLAKLAIAPVYAMQEKKVEKLIGEWNELVGKGFTRTGLQACWRAAQEGNCRILLVEQTYSKPGYLLDDPYYLFLSPPAGKHTTLPDAVDDLIKVVLEKRGTVHFTADELLSSQQKIALITRY